MTTNLTYRSNFKDFFSIYKAWVVSVRFNFIVQAPKQLVKKMKLERL